MKILAIRIKNLASLEGITDIDFTSEPLVSAGIFAITGPTGAGKSTILDALCLALFAQTPRYNKSNDPNVSIQDIGGNTITQSDPRKILRDGAADGYAEVDFAGVDGHRHRAQWSIRRARSKSDGALQAYQISCKDLDSGNDIQGTKTEVLAAITRKVGLSFDQFTRAVLLAQGDFTAFLKAPNSEKSELLEKLTGTQIYSQISKRVFERNRIEKEELNLLEVQKDAISILSEEMLEAFIKQKHELVSTLQLQQQNETRLAKEFAWHEKLESLQKAMTESEKALEQASIQAKDASSRELKLSQVEQVQATKSWLQSLGMQQKLLTDKETKRKEVSTELVLLQEQLRQLQETLKLAAEDLAGKINEQEQALPLLNKAKQLDVQLRDRLKLQLEADEELRQAIEIHREHAEEMHTRKQYAQQLAVSIAKLTEFAAKHQSRKTLAENSQQVVHALAEAKNVLRDEELYLGELQKLRQLHEATTADELKQSEALALLRESEQKIMLEFSTLQQKIAVVDAAALQENKNETDAYVIAIIQASADWKAIYDANTLIEKDKLTLIKNNELLLHIKQEAVNADKELEVSKIRKEAASRALEIAIRESSESVLSLREQLIADQPCPVCGSCEHPYAAHDQRVDRMLNQLEADYKLQDTAHEQALIIQSTVHQQVKQLEKDILEITSGQQQREIQIKELRALWLRYPQHAEAENRVVEEVGQWLNQQLAVQQEKQQNLQAQYAQWQNQQRALDECGKQRDAVNQQYHQAENALKDVRRNIESQKEKLIHTERELDKSIKKLGQTQELLAVYFTNRDWFNHWKSGAEPFIQQIVQFANEWKINTENLDKSNQELKILTATIAGEENKLKLLADDVKKKTSTLNTSNELCATIKAERDQLFEGRATDEVEQQLKNAIDHARQAMEQHKAVQEQKQTSITRSMTQLDEMQQEAARLTLEINALEVKIAEWLSAYNTNHNVALTRSEMENLLHLSAEWIENERKYLRQIHDTLLQAQTVLIEHEIALQNHESLSLSAMDMQAVATALQNARIALQESNREDAEIQLRLRQDAESRKASGEMLKQIAAKERIAENWAKLNQVIGSGDGSKFRRVAQEYTLDVLLQYSNIQLQMLSTRYLLQRTPQSLGLQVVDQDMGNEVRTVNSLSGGESFLVSLALALGLASLSSSRMQVESLFIDEGFGSLDSITLNIAMDALERLHHQGRKVGVISHVEEMSERIAVKIKVSKKGSGRSKVEVIGF